MYRTGPSSVISHWGKLPVARNSPILENLLCFFAFFALLTTNSRPSGHCLVVRRYPYLVSGIRFRRNVYRYYLFFQVRIVFFEYRPGAVGGKDLDVDNRGRRAADTRQGGPGRPVPR